MMKVMSVCNAPMVKLLMKSLYLGETLKVWRRLSVWTLSVCRQRSLDASLPSGITPFTSIDADGYTTVSKALHFFDAFRNGDYSELAVWSGIRDLIIRLLVLRCPRL